MCLSARLISAILSIGSLYGADALVSADPAGPYELCVTCPAPQTRILIIPSSNVNLDTKDQPEIVLVLWGTAREERFQRAFQASWQAGAAGNPRAIDLTLSPGDTLPAGSYDLFLALQPKTKPDAQRLKLTVVRPVPKVSVYPKIIVERTLGTLWNSDRMSEQYLDETSHKSGLKGLRFRLAEPAAAGNRSVSGSLSFTVPSDLPAGAHQRLMYALAGAFPLGTVTGSYKIASDDAVDPLGTFDFEVRTQVWKGYLAAALILGLAASWVLKVRLQQNLEWDQAFLDAAALRDRVRAEEHRHRDVVFRQAYSDKLAELNAALDSKKTAKEINDAKLALDQAWREALQDLAKRKQPELAATEHLDETLRFAANLELPDEVREALDSARKKAAEARRALDDDDLAVSTVSRQEAVSSAAAAWVTFARQWKPPFSRFLQELTQAEGGISAQLVKTMTDQAAPLLTLLDKVNEAAVLETVDDLKQALLNLHAARIAAGQFLSSLAVYQNYEMLKAASQVRQAGVAGWKSQPFEELQRISQEFESFVRASREAPDSKTLAQQLIELKEAWERALQTQFQNRDDEVEELLAAAKYREALARTLQKLTAAAAAGSAAEPPTSKVRMVGQTEFARSPSTEPMGVLSWLNPFSASALTILHIDAGAPAAPSPSVPTPVTVKRALWIAKLQQTLGVGVLATLLGYGLFANTFVGTLADFSTAIFWGFGLDLTVDTILKLTRKSGT